MTSYRKLYFDEISKNDKLNVALGKIKEFANNFCDICPNANDDSSDYCNDGCFLDEIVHPIEKIIDEARSQLYKEFKND